jgi:hypothetical protein
MEDVWYILWSFGIFCGHLVYFSPFGMFSGPLVYLVAIWYIFCPFGMLCHEKSGNPCFLRVLQRRDKNPT